MAYFAIGMALYSEGSYEDVLGQLTDGLAWASGWQEEFTFAEQVGDLPGPGAVGGGAVAGVVRAGGPADRGGAGRGEAAPGWVAGRRLVAVDGTCLDVADTVENEAYFGRPGVTKGERAAFPQARVVALAECGTHAIFAAVVGPLTTGEPTMIEQLLARLEPGMLLLADRGIFSYALWRKASGTGADLLWRIRTDRAGPQPEHRRGPAGRVLAGRAAPLDRGSGTGQAGDEVRVIDYTIEDGRDHPGSYRLFTTILDPAEASAAELAAAYHQRWEIELAFDELKTHQRGPRTVLRSKSPDLVLQEIWGHLCCHYAIRSLMAEAAVHAGHDPDRASFVAALRIARATIAHAGDFPPDDTRHWLIFLRRLITRLLPARRHRASPRVIKRKMPKWQVKRAHHAHWPQPDKPTPTKSADTN